MTTTGAATMGLEQHALHYNNNNNNNNVMSKFGIDGSERRDEHT